MYSNFLNLIGQKPWSVYLLNKVICVSARIKKNKASVRHIQKEVLTPTIALVSQCPICADGNVVEGAHK